MKRIILSLTVLLSLLVSVQAAPTYAGGLDGYITMPSPLVPRNGRIGISAKYMGFKSHHITPALNVVPVRKGHFGLEIGAALDIVVAEKPFVLPLLFGIKIQFAKNAGIGGWVEIPIKATEKTAFNVFFAWETVLRAGKYGTSSATAAIGYTFKKGMDANINFHAGIQQRFFVDRLYLIADFANYPFRQTSTIGMQNQDDKRAIINVGLRFHLLSWMTLDAVGVDLMDDSRGINFSLNLYLLAN